MQQDFLNFLRKKPSSWRRPSADADAGIGEFFFKITSDAGGFASLQVVDRDGNTISPDPYNFPGEEGAFLRVVERLKEEQMLKINWGESDPSLLRLTDYPYLVYQLIRCSNVVNDSMQPVSPSERRGRLLLTLKASETESSLLPEWNISLPDDNDGNENVTTTDFLMLNDSFVLAGDRIYPLLPIGQFADRLSYFISPFAADMAELFLSVVYSNVDNFILDWDDYDVRRSSTAIVEHPAVVFEKVDSDLSLHVRVGAVVGGIAEDAVRSFDLTLLAQINPDNHRVTVSPISRADVQAAAEEINEMIRDAAPTRRDARELYFHDNYFIIPENLASPFLFKCLPRLLERFDVLGTDKLKDYKVTPVKPKLNIRYRSGIDFLEGEATVTLGSDTITLGALFEQYRRDRYVKLSDGNRAVIDAGYIKRLERIFGDKKNAGKDVKITYFDLPEIEDLLTNQLDPKFFERQRKVFEGFNDLSAEQLSVPSLKAVLRPYQKEGVKWIDYLYRNRLGGCLADDMGLGKTVQTIAVLSKIYPGEEMPTLLVMPRSLIFNWENELKRFAPDIRFHTYYGPGRDFDEALKADVILTTYAIVRNDIEKLKDIDFNYVVLDESQNIKNLEAQTTRAVFLLKARHRLALSGTPIENNLTELYSLFRFLNPGMFGDLDDFNRRYAAPIQRDQDQEATKALRRRIFPFMLRRLKKDVLKDLPDRVEQTLYVEMTPEQAEYYEQRRRAFKEKVDETVAKEGINKAQFVMFQALTELRRIASVPESLTDDRIRSPKLDLLIDNLTEATANGHKCVVFFTYIAGLELTGEALAARGIGFASMTGATHNRREVIESFNNDSDCMVLLMTLKTGGVGLNLTVADTVFIFEPWWNKAAEEQAINRLHRIGQKAKVISYSLITRDTIEEKIRQLQEQKAELFDSLIEADSTTGKKLSQEDINFILGK